MFGTLCYAHNQERKGDNSKVINAFLLATLTDKRGGNFLLRKTSA